MSLWQPKAVKTADASEVQAWISDASAVLKALGSQSDVLEGCCIGCCFESRNDSKQLKRRRSRPGSLTLRFFFFKKECNFDILKDLIMGNVKYNINQKSGIVPTVKSSDREKNSLTACMLFFNKAAYDI